MRVGCRAVCVLTVLVIIQLAIHFSRSGRRITRQILTDHAARFIFLDSSTPTMSSDTPYTQPTQPPPPQPPPQDTHTATTYLKPHSPLNLINVGKRSAPDMPRLLNDTYYNTYINLLDEVSQLFFRHNISFSMLSGTLIGSYVAHDILPWDDDMDFMIRFADLPKVKRLFKNATLWQRMGLHTFAEFKDKTLDVNEYNFEYLQSFPDNSSDEEYYNWKYQTPNTKFNRHKFKLFYHDGIPTKFQWKWPFIDFIYYGENATHVWKMWGRNMAVPKHTFLPLQLRPMGRLWMPAPRDTDYFLKEEYKQFLCKTHFWSHVRQHKQVSETVKCRDLVGYYPFVWRQAVEEGMLEVLKLNETVIQSVLLPYSLCSLPPFGIEQPSAITGLKMVAPAH